MSLGAGKAAALALTALLLGTVQPGRAQGSDPDRALLVAVRNKDFTDARLLIEAGANVNARDESGLSAFLMVASSGEADLMRLVLRKGALPDSRDTDGATALIRAARGAHTAVMIELLRAGAELDHTARNGRTALCEAVAAGDGGPRHTDAVRVLVRAGADQGIRDNTGMTALQYARQRGFLEMAAVLVSSGGN